MVSMMTFIPSSWAVFALMTGVALMAGSFSRRVAVAWS